MRLNPPSQSRPHPRCDVPLYAIMEASKQRGKRKSVSPESLLQVSRVQSPERVTQRVTAIHESPLPRATRTRGHRRVCAQCVTRIPPPWPQVGTEAVEYDDCTNTSPRVTIRPACDIGHGMHRRCVHHGRRMNAETHPSPDAGTTPGSDRPWLATAVLAGVTLVGIGGVMWWQDSRDKRGETTPTAPPVHAGQLEGPAGLPFTPPASSAANESNATEEEWVTPVKVPATDAPTPPPERPRDNVLPPDREPPPPPPGSDDWSTPPPEPKDAGEASSTRESPEAVTSQEPETPTTPPPADVPDAAPTQRRRTGRAARAWRQPC